MGNSSYNDEVSVEKDKETLSNVNDLIARLGMANASLNAENEEELEKKRLAEKEAREKALSEEEGRIFEEKYKEEQARRKAFEEELAEKEAEEEAAKAKEAKEKAKKKASEKKEKEDKKKEKKEKKEKGSFFAFGMKKKEKPAPAVLPFESKKEKVSIEEEKKETLPEPPENTVSASAMETREKETVEEASSPMSASDFADKRQKERGKSSFDLSKIKVPKLSFDIKTREEESASGPVISKMKEPHLTRKQRKEKALADARQKELERLAYEDPLTGYPNRNKFEDDLDAMTGDVSAILVSVPKYEEAVKVLGKDAGDQLIRGIQFCMEETIDSTKTYRVDLDKFLIVYVGARAKKIRLETAALEGKCKEKGVTYEDKVLTLSIILDMGHGTSLRESTKEMLSDERKMKKKEVHVLRDDREAPLIAGAAVPVQGTKPASASSIPSKPDVKPQNISPGFHEKLDGRTVNKRTIKTDKSRPTTHILSPIEVDYSNITKNETPAKFIPPQGDGEYEVAPIGAETEALKADLAGQNGKAASMSITEMTEDILSKKENLIMIAIASNDMENLMLMRDADKFLSYCEAAEDQIYVSYIYAIYSGYGAVYYLEKPETEIVQKIFNDIGDLFMKNDTVNGPMLSKIPNIGIFKRIYI